MIVFLPPTLFFIGLASFLIIKVSNAKTKK